MGLASLIIFDSLQPALVGVSIGVETPGGVLVVKVLSINGRQGGGAGD